MIDSFILGQLAIGFSVGMTYALVAIGLTLIYRVLRAVNFAHGDVYTLGAFATLVAATSLQLPLWMIFPVVALTGAGFGWLVERAAFRPFRKFTDEASLKSRAVREATLLSSFAVGVITRELLDQVYHGEWLSMPEAYMLNRPLEFGSIQFSLAEVMIAVTSVLMLIALQLLLNRTRIGLAIRAVSSNLVGAQFSGIDINRVILAVFVIGSVLGASAGMIVSLAYGTVQSFMGLTVVVKAFVAMVLGGLTSIPGAVIAGILIGLAEAGAGMFLPSAWAEMVAYLILILTLLFLPNGLFGRRSQA